MIETLYLRWKWAQVRSKMLPTKCVKKLYIFYMYKEDLAEITYNGWYAIKPNPTKSYIFNIYV